MINFFSDKYSSIINKSTFLTRIRYYSTQRFLIRLLANIVLPIYFKLTANNLNYRIKLFSGGKCDILVSLTSFPARINRVWLTVETILRQTYKPDKIILWLSKEQFPNFDNLPKNLLNLQNRGLKIELRDGDLKSHKKYYYTLQEYPNDIMITIDDDIYYRMNMLETLISYSNVYPNCIISNYSNLITRKGLILDNYTNWKSLKKESIGYDVFFGSGGGTLFPASCFHQDVLNHDVFIKICKNADDVWLNAMCRLNSKYVVKTDYNSSLLPVLNKQNITLASTNLSGENDIQIKLVIEYCKDKFGVDPFGLV